MVTNKAVDKSFTVINSRQMKEERLKLMEGYLEACYDRSQKYVDDLKVSIKHLKAELYLTSELK